MANILIVTVNALTGEYVSGHTFVTDGNSLIGCYTSWDELKPYILNSVPWEAQDPENNN